MIAPMRLGTQQTDVHVIAHDGAWARAYATESARVRTALGELLTGIEHVGSTSVPGLAAKPTVDMQATVAAEPIPVAGIALCLAPLDYVHVPFPDDGDYPMFARPGTGHRLFHLHVCVAGGHQERRHLAVRDYLRAHPAEAAAYGELKARLASAHPADRPAYVAGKDVFVKALEQRALAWATRS